MQVAVNDFIVSSRLIRFELRASLLSMHAAMPAMRDKLVADDSEVIVFGWLECSLSWERLGNGELVRPRRKGDLHQD